MWQTINTNQETIVLVCDTAHEGGAICIFPFGIGACESCSVHALLKVPSS